MKTKITWFLIGAIASWLIWSTISYIRLRPRDYTQSWSAEMQSIAGRTWLTNAYGRNHGPVNVFTPADRALGVLQVQFAGAAGLPGIDIQDCDTNGVPDAIVVADRSHRSLSIDLDGGSFASIRYSTGISTASVFYADSNCDGVYDMAVGPGLEVRVWIENQWHALVITNRQSMIQQGQALIPVTATNGVWRIEDKELPTMPSSEPLTRGTSPAGLEPRQGSPSAPG